MLGVLVQLKTNLNDLKGLKKTIHRPSRMMQMEVLIAWLPDVCVVA